MPVGAACLSLLLACSPNGSDDTASEDCDTSSWFLDQDGDGYGAGEAVTACTAPAHHVASGNDCDDGDDTVFPEAPELCNGIDDDCDDIVDPDDATDALACYRDADEDGFGDPDVSFEACDCGDHYVEDGTDCDDSDPDTWPGAAETWYDGIDQDCRGLDDEYDRDGDGFDWEDSGGTDCDDEDAAVNPDADDQCGNGVDDNCDGAEPMCGLEGEVAADSAHLRIERSPSSDPVAWFGQALVPGGDSDGDGDQELIAPQICDENSNEKRIFRLELAGSGVHHPTALATATWEIGDEDEGYCHSGTLGTVPSTIAGWDLNDDGALDYLFSSDSDSDSSTGRLDLWLGPATGDNDLREATTLTDESASAELGGAVYLVVHPGDEDWQLATTLRHDSDEWKSRPAVRFYRQEHFDGATDPATAPTILTNDTHAPGHTMNVRDVDGDGVLDIALGTVDEERTQDQRGRMWVLRGPFDDDRHVDDADLVVEGWERHTRFGERVGLVTSPGGEILLATSFNPDGEAGIDENTVWFFDAGQEGAIGEESVLASYVDSMGYSVGLWNIVDLGDFDGDGKPEIGAGCDHQAEELVNTGCVYVSEAPTEGTHIVEDAEAIVTTEDDNTAFGYLMMGEADLNGDSWPDLAIGEQLFDNEDELGDEHHTPAWGRIVVFRGGPHGF